MMHPSQILTLSLPTVAAVILATSFSPPASAIRASSRTDKDGVRIYTTFQFHEGDAALTNQPIPGRNPIIPVNAIVNIVKTAPEIVISYRSGEVLQTVSLSDIRQVDQNNLSLQLYSSKRPTMSSAASCAPRDLRGLLGAPRDQGKRGWCYAYATADYLSWLTGQKVSAADFGLRETLRQSFAYNGKRSLAPADGGLNTASLRDILNYGYWLERDFPSEDRGSKYSETLKRIARSEGEKHASCEAPQKLSSSLMQSVAVDTETVRAVDDMLDLYQPTVLGILARYLFRDDAPPVDRAALEHGEIEIKDGHAILVVARRELNGKCEYFLRNSWGEQCATYSEKLKKTCEPKAGGVWVDRDRLEKMTMQTVFLQ